MASADFEAECEVVRWTARLRDQGRPLFSHELRPGITTTRVLGVHGAGRSRFVVDSELLATLVREVVQKRHAMVADGGESHPVRCDIRRLCWYPELTDFIALGLETGIVDDCDAPAWDLWTRVDRRDAGLCLVAAVPSWLESMAERAIALSPTACLEWE